MREEYEVLNLLEPSGLAPKAYWFDKGSVRDPAVPPFIIQEFIEGMTFRELKRRSRLSEGHVQAVGRAIALLNMQDIGFRQLPFMHKYAQRAYEWSVVRWVERLSQAVLRARRGDVIRWAARIFPVALTASLILERHRSLLPRKAAVFHFDGAHLGNILLTERVKQRIKFIDLQRVSIRNDPAFTLVRFATSIADKRADPGKQVVEILINAYLEARPDLDRTEFENLFFLRLLERAVSDLVWVLWNPFQDPKQLAQRRRNPQPVEKWTAVGPRYNEAKAMLGRPIWR
jgi:hypothetical protein